MAIAIALVGVTLALLRPLAPKSRDTAIQLATRHFLEVYAGMNLDHYTISAPTLPDWFEEWAVYFNHKAHDAGILIDVAGGGVYNGNEVRVFVDNEWGKGP